MEDGPPAIADLPVTPPGPWNRQFALHILLSFARKLLRGLQVTCLRRLAALGALTGRALLAHTASMAPTAVKWVQQYAAESAVMVAGSASCMCVQMLGRSRVAAACVSLVSSACQWICVARMASRVAWGNAAHRGNVAGRASALD